MGRFGRQLARSLVTCACVAPALLFAAGNCDDSSQDALALLEQMSRAGMAVGHSGMATLQRGGDMRVLQIHRNSDAGDITDTLTLLTGQPARVVRSGHPEDCAHPGHSLLQLQQSRSGERACGVAAHYRLSVERGDRVAGRPTHRIIAQPRDMYRYGHVLEVDEETAQLLKTTTLTADGRPLEQFQYASLALDVGAGTEADEASVATYRHPASHPGGGLQTQAAADDRRWQPEWLPAGFVATQDDVTGSRQTYTDGMASFSIFLESVDTAMQPGEGAVREGSTLSYTRGMRLAGSQVLVTVVGEVPVNTARIVADSVTMR